MLTTVTCRVNSTPMPTAMMRMTAGTALSLMPTMPMKPNSSTNIIASTST